MATRAYVFDLDGVLYRGNDAIDGAADALARLRARTPPAALFFLTNNSTQPRTEYADKLARMGMPCSPEEIVTSASATAAYLQSQGAEGRTALVVGGPGIRDELRRVGVRVLDPDPDEDWQTAPVPDADFVVVGMDRAFRYITLWRAQQAILHGAAFVATNRDGSYPIEGDRVIPGGGAIVAAIEASTDTTPLVIGKPAPHGLQTILDMAGVRPDEALMIGDRLDTDILCANRIGVPSVLVLTGVTSESRVADAPPEMRPTYVLSTLRELE